MLYSLPKHEKFRKLLQRIYVSTRSDGGLTYLVVMANSHELGSGFVSPLFYLGKIENSTTGRPLQDKTVLQLSQKMQNKIMLITYVRLKERTLNQKPK